MSGRSAHASAAFPVPEPISYARQSLDEADIAAVVEVLRSDWLTQGPVVARFEQALASTGGAAHAVAVNSATSALHLACLALGLGPGDRLWTSPNTYVATANCARYCGAEIGFVDIDPHTGNLSPAALAEKLARAERDGMLPKIVIAVHFAGQSCDMRAIRVLSERYGFHVIEDASHALGARYLGEPVGNGRYSDATIFSFHPVKIITTGEGGAALTNREELRARMALLRSHGITRDAGLFVDEAHGAWYYEQQELGHNYRLSDFQAALGISQLRRLDRFIARRHAIAHEYDRRLAALPLIIPYQHPDAWSSYHLYPVRVAAHLRRRVFDDLRARGIQANVHYQPVHLQPYYRRLGFAPGDFPHAERHYRETISLPMHAALRPEQQDAVIRALEDALS